MSSSNFLETNIPLYTNLNSSTSTATPSDCTNYIMDNLNFGHFDYLLLGDYDQDHASHDRDCSSWFPISLLQTPPSPENLAGNSDNASTGHVPRSCNIKCEGGTKRIKMEVGCRIAFRTKSVLEIMDDGFKWRKYGKKSVKNSPNPRNYYRCANRDCNVKKRVERDREDSSYVITTDEGVHNHESPCLAYCTQLPLMHPQFLIN